MSPKLKITKAYLANYIQSVAVGQPTKEAVQQDLDPFLSLEYTINRGGVEQDYAENLAHIARTRAVIADFKFEMYDFVCDELAGTFASRNHSFVTGVDGEKVTLEVVLFGTFNREGKFTHIYERLVENGSKKKD
ncbi:hypothetical protein EJ08DRAFT_24099 [Tothia fuscella]|uniref:SnoaL-like domain-containing protein n=1 Tax=Tothia fuscella TaxID=1048955 RepID=A0A9P4NZI7_9PEZI|nr:hypothetical protein EJ08DRAFT_24099 [Tothia fuscella]